MTESSPSAKYQFRSDLSQMPLPEVLATVHRYRVPGVIDCHRGGDIKSIFLDAGSIIFASSSDTRDSLGDRLLASGLISREQYDESVRRLHAENKRQGTILVEMKALEPKDLFLAVRDQVQSIVWSVFEWSEGGVFFEPGRDRVHEFIKLNIPIPQAILQGVRAMADPRPLLARVGTKLTVLQKNTDADMTDIVLTPGESALLDAVDGRKTLYELASHPAQTPIENAKAIYIFFVLHLITVKAARQVTKVQLKVNPG